MDNDQAKQLFDRADSLYDNGDFAGALAILDNLDQTFPDTRHIMYPRAKCLAAMGRAPEAMDLCDRIITEHGYEPAAELKAYLERKQQPAPPAGVPGTGPAAPHHRRPPIRRGPGIAFFVGLIGFLLLLAGGGAYAYYYIQDMTAEEGTQTAQAEAPAESPPSAEADAAGPAAAATPPAADPTSVASGSTLAIDTSGPPEIVKVGSDVSEPGVTVNASVEFGVWTACGTYDCFLEKYRACEPAAIRMQAMGNFIVEYRVLGAEGGLCRIEATMVQMPPYPSWNGQSMTCDCDNSMDFVQLTEQISESAMTGGTLNCEGPLYDAMRATMSDYQR